ncbi:MAG: lytic transglycosylase domain-containing protein [Solirubrobacterales bacterium]|nr:lytic transglycosylase domain-containing protein [Solirubrobacterales bacterium]
MPSAVSARSRREGERRAAARRTAARRRRSFVGICGIGLLALAVALLLPLLTRAVDEFALPLAYQDVIREQAAAKHIDPALIAAVIYAETKFNPRPSAAGAQGPMQIMPQTALYLARRSGATTFTTADLQTPEVNIAYGSYYLRFLLDRYGGSETLALAAYNGGIANVDQWVARARARGQRLTIAGIPFPETRAYVEKVLRAQREYRRRYATELGYRERG